MTPEPGSSPSTVEDDDLAVLVALAETLIPSDETPGADAEWATSFALRQMSRHPDACARFQALARHIEALATADHQCRFERLPVPTREALLTKHYPSLRDDAELGAEGRAVRQTMREIITGFLIADELDIHDDPFFLGASPRRDRASPSPSDYATTDVIPDLAVDRRMATNSGRGVYRRVWLAAGYASPPGLAQRPEELATIPDAPITIRTKPRS